MINTFTSNSVLSLSLIAVRCIVFYRHERCIHANYRWYKHGGIPGFRIKLQTTLTTLWRFSGHIRLVGDPGVEPKQATAIIYLIWFEKVSGSLRRNWKRMLGRVMFPPATVTWPRVNNIKWMNGDNLTMNQ